MKGALLHGIHGQLVLSLHHHVSGGLRRPFHDAELVELAFGNELV